MGGGNRKWFPPWLRCFAECVRSGLAAEVDIPIVRETLIDVLKRWFNSHKREAYANVRL
jgi:hypothetical protein